jgi:hypothetical protein
MAMKLPSSGLRQPPKVDVLLNEGLVVLLTATVGRPVTPTRDHQAGDGLLPLSSFKAKDGS